MLFTWDTNNLCIVFKSWRVTSTMSLIWSLLGVVILTAGYELIRELSRRYEAKVQREIDDLPSKCSLPPSSPPSTPSYPCFPPLPSRPFALMFCLCLLACLLYPWFFSRSTHTSWLKWHDLFYKDDGEGSSLLASGRSAADAHAKSKTIKAAFYAVQVFYSFFIM